ncbi:pyrroloquinoline quinone biosynthesis protein PqqE [Aurantimonas sp. C2-6-R+9]|uniref:pyrroloquinoline quinone biosynthesis protein PqqE n=1 Tax=unclassified Aurantimonas TaxID=2638230 RepID=UPI002E18DD62|nr:MULTISPECIES: pyrroloquinoline quinone biosynthesis protein PqqE [unclassified Aurantimonas]MEC5291619.1 pyrroloquinoline quinone biosynthesis protein PqqE [Aurantimonas sp. C2-3-R2]MEC5381759.1 pyrroloquinoline quinone biosynthesis protein PqqE [Aurantimonas sp. C2-6-R+9]MEC5412703.1 pyrroloquinoline quinone biosynthesis protein PqqE [Aurantimonas sp. C2-4-R8]
MNEAVFPKPAAEAAERPAPQPPLGLLAELTHRCPLRCTYCSNPLELDTRSSELDTETWKRVFTEAAELGVIHIHLSGGEPTARKDIVELTRHAAEVGLYTNLITSGIGVSEAQLDALFEAGCDHIQLSLQGADAGVTERVAGYKGGFEKKEVFARAVVARGFPLTLNAVIHRMNIHQLPDMINKAVAFGAKRMEIAHTQYYGWALKNRAQLMPAREDVDRTIGEVEAARERLKGTLVIDAVFPDYYAKYPKLCNGGWGTRTLSVTPAGKALPCHAAETIEHLEFWSVRDHSLADIWASSPAFEAYRGTAWMKEPCRSCERRHVDYGGCRCQALALTGDPANADPACVKSDFHERLGEIATTEASTVADPGAATYRGFRKR